MKAQILYGAEIVYVETVGDKKKLRSVFKGFVCKDDAIRYVDGWKDTETKKLKIGKVWEFTPVFEDEIVLKKRVTE